MQLAASESVRLGPVDRPGIPSHLEGCGPGLLARPHVPVVLDVRVVSGTGGGPDKTILNSPRHLERAGYRMVCAYLHPPGDPGFDVIRGKAQLRRAPLVSVPDGGPLDWRVLPRLLEICRRERVRIWHGHDYKSNALGLLLSKFWPMRLVTTVHGWVQHTRRTPLYYAIDRVCLPFYEKVFCVSPDLYQLCRRRGVSSAVANCWRTASTWKKRRGGKPWRRRSRLWATIRAGRWWAPWADCRRRRASMC